MAIGISVIVPAYNSAMYIQKAIDSVLCQSFKDFELIIIDDSSTDNTVDIVQKKYYDDRRVRVLCNKSNYGQGESRNRGIEDAKGDYIFFLDSDDWIEAETLQTLYNCAKKNNAEVVACGTRMVDKDGKAYPFHSQACFALGGIKALELLAERTISVYIWDKLYSRDFIQRNLLRFPPIYQEDLVFLVQALYYCNIYVSISDQLYNYFLSPASTSRGKVTAKHIHSSIEAVRLNSQFFNAVNSEKKIIDDELIYKIQSILSEVIAAYISGLYESTEEKSICNSILDKVYLHHFSDRSFYVKTAIDCLIAKEKKTKAEVIQLLKILNTKKKSMIIFFGTGAASEKIREYFPLQIKYFVDNDQQKWGTRIEELPIYNPMCLLEEEKENLAIMIASQYHADISSQLEKMGFEENKHFWNIYYMYQVLRS